MGFYFESCWGDCWWDFSVFVIVWGVFIGYLKNLGGGVWLVVAMGGSTLTRQHSSGAAGLLETLNMETVRTILTHPYPYPHEHSRHAVIAVVVGCLFFISSDNMHTLIQKLDNNIKWWSMYACLLGFFYFFSSPFVGKTIKPSYSNFSRWWVFLCSVRSYYGLFCTKEFTEFVNKC